VKSLLFTVIAETKRNIGDGIAGSEITSITVIAEIKRKYWGWTDLCLGTNEFHICMTRFSSIAISSKLSSICIQSES
jgi:hypothetical protein